MDALRQLDEMKRIQSQLPAITSSLTLTMPMAANLRDLKPEELDVLQLVHNYGSFNGVLDHSPQDDLQVAEVVADLIKRDYVRGG
jgi:hypothetical protein